MPFGDELGSGVGGRGPGNGFGVADDLRQKFTGKERDIETGLDYFGARYFASTQGRFTSPDPLLSSGRPEMPESWNRYAYTLNNPLKFIDPDGLYEWGASLGGDLADDKVSDVIRKRRELFRATLAKDRANLAALEKTYGKDSKEYEKAEKAVNAYGTEHDGNKVFIGVMADNKQRTVGNTTEMNSQGNVYVTFKKSYFDQGLATQPGGQPNTVSLEGAVAHEGWHINETKNGIKLGTWDSEYNGESVHAVMGAATYPNGYAFFTLGSGVAAKQVIYWNSSWAAADRPTERDKAIKQVLQAPRASGGYGLSPPVKKR
jgi:RHS repeat-associated protein